MNPLVSIIVPVYNSEKYLDYCIASILNQTFINFELILINDGSTDSSGSICDKYAMHDNRIIVKHIPNYGVSNARNEGLDIATGEYIFYIDSDDLLSGDIFQRVSLDLIESSSDMILYSFNYIDDKLVILRQDINEDTGTITGIDAVCKYIRWNIKVCMGSYFVKRKLIEENSIRFYIGCKYGEDVEFINRCLINSSKVTVKKDVILNYRMHEGSAIHKINFTRFDNFYSRMRFREFASNNFSTYTKLLNLIDSYSLPEVIISNINLLCRSGINYKKIIQFLNKNNCYEILNKSLKNDNTPVKFKREIEEWIRSPFWYFLRRRIVNHYSFVRQFLGLNKRKLLTFMKG